MIITRTDKEIIIRLPSNVDITGLLRLVDFLTYKEVTAGSKAKQLDVNQLANEVKKGWWANNRNRFVK